MILVVLILIKLPVFLLGLPMFSPELIWNLTGGRLAEGHLMYKDVVETLEPFSAGTYYFISLFVSHPHFIFIFLSTLLIFIQAIVFNTVLSVNNVFPERNYVPALLYVIFSSIFIDFYTLSPALLGTTFILLAAHFILIIIRTGDNDENIFYVGIFISIATLFYYPYFIFIFLAILSFIFFTPTMVRKYFVVLMGFIFPFILVATYYFMRDGLKDFLYCFFHSMFSSTEFLVSLKSLVIVLIVPLAFLLISFAIISMASRYINYQYVVIKILGLWFILSLFTLFFTNTFSASQLFVFVPVLSFFISHFFLLVKNKWFREVPFFILAIIIIGTNIKYLNEFHNDKSPVGYQKMIIGKKENLPIELKDKNILVLGDDKSYYVGNKLGGAYLNWKISSEVFSDLDNYQNISKLYRQLSNDMPPVIIDQNNVIPTLFEKIPSLEKSYTRSGEYNIYLLKKEN